MKRLIPYAYGLALSLAGWSMAATAGDSAAYVRYSASGSFDDVMQALQMAIQDRGMYINNVMHMGEMLERTGKDLGATEVLFARAESVEFCSAALSRKMIGGRPDRLLNCPFIISVYTLPNAPEQVYVTHRNLFLVDQDPIMQDVETMLESVAKAAASGF